MFDFQKLSVYQRAKEFNNLCSKVAERNALDKNIKNQLTRAALSIVLNIAEGSGKKTKRTEIVSLLFQEVRFMNVCQF